jgi:hypothetical protein
MSIEQPISPTANTDEHTSAFLPLTTFNDIYNALLPLNNGMYLINALSLKSGNALSPLNNTVDFNNCLSPSNNANDCIDGSPLNSIGLLSNPELGLAEPSIHERVSEDDRSYNDDTLPDELVQLHVENQNILQGYSNKTQEITEKFEKFSAELEDMKCNLNTLINEKNQKEIELSNKFREKYRLWKKKVRDFLKKRFSFVLFSID